MTPSSASSCLRIGLALALLAPVAAWAQMPAAPQPATAALTLEAAVARAMESNPAIAAARLRQNIALG